MFKNYMKRLDYPTFMVKETFRKLLRMSNVKNETKLPKRAL